MPIDWDKANKTMDEAVKNASNKTSDQLAGKISSLCHLTDDEIISLFPEPADAKKLYELIKQVKSAEDRNTKINNIVKNAEEFGGVILTILDKFI